MDTKKIIGVFAVALSIVFILVGLFKMAASKNQQQPIAQTKAVTYEESDNMLCDKNTIICVTTRYDGCGHTDARTAGVPTGLAGASVSAIKAYYADRDFEKYENNTIYFSESRAGKCSHHYILRARGNKISVVYQQNEAGVKDEYNFSPEHLPEGDLERLQNGIYAESDQELAALIEDFTS